MTDLLDVNVWLALADENHIHHSRALAYWQKESSPRIAFCRVTALGFLRLSTHPKILSRPLTPQEAWEIYHRYRSEAGVEYIDDSAAIDRGFRHLSCEMNFPHHLWTDAYLAALAEFKSCRVVSFDGDFSRFSPLDFLHLSEED
jgi:toxin-antitoxin system PIN domain toxin